MLPDAPLAEPVEGAPSADVPHVASSSLASDSPATVKRRLRLIGLQMNGGLPGGSSLSLVIRPLKWVRADAGVGYNGFSLGAQGGITVIPFHWAVVPTLRLEAGRFFRSDVNSKVSDMVDDVPAYLRPALSGFGYDYATTQLGLEFGSQRSFVFFLRAGLGWIRADFGDGTALRGEDSGNVEYDVSGLSVRASGPTANLGFLVYFW